ncbi:MAG: hypothetical protein IBX55_18720 [Methyloprofundus sp.]|nr:hypothetical protein [Methyloprofundus sp.]
MFKDIHNNLPASIVVFFIALLLCLGIALASAAAPLFSGIIAGIVGAIVVGSPLGVIGPTAGLAVLVFSAISKSMAYDVLEIIKNYESNAKTKNITVEKINFIGPVTA